MAKVIEDGLSFRADRAWGALELAEVEGASVRLHWADRPYQWHVNDGTEVFAVIHGSVVMHYRTAEGEKSVRLEPGSVFVAEPGDEHVAVPEGEARIIVIERKGSI